ncbi:TPA: hypothetical protein ACFB8A_001696 [Neisseria gonorrhoeae]
MNNNFDRSKHIYHNEAFVELVKDAIRFFHGTPVHTLPPPKQFKGAGVYAISISVTILCTNNMRTGTDYPTMRQFMLARPSPKAGGKQEILIMR